MPHYDSDRDERERAREYLRNSRKRKRSEEEELEELKKQEDEAKDRFIASFMIIGFLTIVCYKFMTGTF